MPTTMDPRHGYPTNTQLNKAAGFKGWETNGALSSGRDSLSGKYTVTGVIGNMAYRALGRLALQRKTVNKPFSLSVQ